VEFPAIHDARLVDDPGLDPTVEGPGRYALLLGFLAVREPRLNWRRHFKTRLAFV
jgi:hypothetical protein